MTGISVAVAGFGWMGRVHTQAYLRLRQHYPQLPVIRLAAVADEVPGRGEEAADQFGFEAFTPGLARYRSRSGHRRGEHHGPELLAP